MRAPTLAMLATIFALLSVDCAKALPLGSCRPPPVVSRLADIRPVRMRRLLVVAALSLSCHGGVLSPL